MSKSLNRKILIRLSLLLFAALLADRLLFSTGMNQAEIANRIEFLQAELSRTPDAGAVAELAKRLGEATEHINAPLSARQQYLESLIGQDFIVLVDPTAPVEVPDWPGRSIVTFKLRLRMTLVELFASLAALDNDNQPMRVERLRIVPADEELKTLQVEMTVTTITETASAQSAGGAALVSTVELVPEARRLPEVTPKNIFFPVIDAIARAKASAEITLRSFTLVGVDLNGKPSRALLMLSQTGETVWMEPQATIDSATLTKIDANGVEFDIAGDACRLDIGSSSELLLLGRRNFKSNCTIIGVVREGRQWLAMAMFPGQTMPEILGIGDELPSGKIVAISEQSITLDRGGYEDIVRIGHDSDEILYPGFGGGYE